MRNFSVKKTPRIYGSLLKDPGIRTFEMLCMLYSLASEASTGIMQSPIALNLPTYSDPDYEYSTVKQKMLTLLVTLGMVGALSPAVVASDPSCNKNEVSRLYNNVSLLCAKIKTDF